MARERDIKTLNERLEEGAARKVFIPIAGASVIALIMCTAYERIAQTVPINSDNAASLLQAHEFIQGNFILRGWTVGNISAYATELPYYVVGLGIAGFTPTLLRVVPALVFTVIVGLSLYLVYCETAPRDRRSAIAVTFLLLALPWGFATNLILVSSNHVGTVAMLLAAIVCLALIEKGSAQWWLYHLFLLFLTSAILDDELAIFVGALPIVIVLTISLAFDSTKFRSKRLVLGTSAALSIPLGRGIAWLIFESGGFVTWPPKPAFTTWRAIPHSSFLAFRGILVLFGVDPLDPNGSFRAPLYQVSSLIHLLGLGLVIIGSLHIVRKRLKGADSADLIAQILVVAIASDLGCYLISDRAIDIQTTRYLTPSLVYGSVVAGLMAPRLIDISRVRSLAAAVVIVYVSTFAAGLFAPEANQDERAAVDWLLAHHLTEGYGDYWAADIITAESGERVKIRQVTASGDALHPMPWLSNSRWYTSAATNDSFDFLVLDGTGASGVTETSAVNIFGKPRVEYQIAGYKVLVWNKPLVLSPRFGNARRRRTNGQAATGNS